MSPGCPWDTNPDFRRKARAKSEANKGFGLWAFFFIEDVKDSQTLHCKCILNIIYIILIYTQIKGSLWMGWVGVVIF